MKLLGLLAFLVAGFAICTIPVPLAAQAATGKHMLWRVQHQGSTVYLAGSIHALTADAYPLGTAFDKAFADADRLVFEVDMDSLTARAPEMLTLGMYTNGRTLRDALAPETWQMLEAALPAYGMPPQVVSALEPWLVAMMLTQIEFQKAGMLPEHGVDMYFHKRAAQAGKPVTGLESVDFQMGLFDSLSEAQQDTFLQMTLAQLDSTPQVISEMRAAWLAGDADALARLTDTMREHPVFHRKLLTARNEAWLPQIEEYIKGDEDVLVVVGAGHLVGADGVVAMLRERGYQVDQM